MNSALTHIRETLLQIKSDIMTEIIGQEALVDKLVITFFAGGHSLLEGVPGLGKTKTIRTFAKVLGLDTGRVSFTPDLLPSDLTGNEIYRPSKGTFETRKGPIFTNILLADEINRTPPKVQSALLEAMEERKVTIGDETLVLPQPFVVFATQNPLEHEGTYPLPEAQLDRFLMRIKIDYPARDDEEHILRTEGGIHSVGATSDKKNKTLHTPNASDLIEMMQYIATNIIIDDKIYTYISDLLTTLRARTGGENPSLSYGPSTRAGLSLIRAGRVRALIEGRDYILPEDIKDLAHDILDHRMGVSYMAASDGMTTYQVTSEVLDNVKIP